MRHTTLPVASKPSPTICERSGCREEKTRRGLWVIYDEPRSYSEDRFVARKFFIGPVFTLVTDDEICAPTLSALRDLLPAGLINIGRAASDPQSVVEHWA